MTDDTYLDQIRRRLAGVSTARRNILAQGEAVVAGSRRVITLFTTSAKTMGPRGFTSYIKTAEIRWDRAERFFYEWAAADIKYLLNLIEGSCVEKDTTEHVVAGPARHEVLTLRCAKHPSYTAMRKPRSDCPGCWALWHLEHPNDEGKINVATNPSRASNNKTSLFRQSHATKGE